MRLAERFKVSPQVLLLGFAALLNDTSSEMIYPLLPLFLTEYAGASAFIIGVIEGTAEAIAAILKLASGWLSDRAARRKPFIVGGYFIAAASRALIGVANVWGVVFGARLFDRIGKGLRSAPRDALISDVTPIEHRGRAFGLHRSMDHLGAVIGPLTAAAILAFFHVELPTLFLIATIPALAGVVILFAFLREPRHEEIVHSASDPVTDTSAKLPRQFWFAMLAVGVFYLANSSDVYLILQASRSGVSAAVIPLLWAAHHVVKALFSPYAGIISDRTDRRRLLIAGWAIYAVIYAIFPFSRSTLGFVVLFVAYSIPFTLTEGIERAWISDLVPRGIRGKAYGVFYLVIGFCTLAGTLLFGYLFDRVSPSAAFFTGASIAALSAVIVAIQLAFSGRERA